jgi:hypothetical protein
MNQKELHRICVFLDCLDKKEHIFFMSKEEYDKEFDWLFPVEAKPPIFSDNQEEAANCVIGSFVFNGITFHIIDHKIK